MTSRHIVLGLIAMLAASWVAAQEATTNRSTELRERPAAESKPLATLPARTPVKLLGREGGWSQVDAREQRGWLPTFHLRFAAAVETSSPSPALSVTSMLGMGSRQSPETSKVATLGVRGLTRDQFQAASPDAAALRQLHSYRVPSAEAEAFAQEGGLVAVKVPLSGGSKS